MSTQSGITASEAVVSECTSFLRSPTRRALILKIDTVTLSIKVQESVQCSDFSTDLKQLTENLTCDECCYILLRHDAEKHAFISYVPDNASVRSKMLYASTKNTLLQELGSGLFDPILFINSPEELSPQSWNKIMGSGNVKALSESEESLQAVKDHQLYATSNPRRLANDSNNTLSFPLDDQLHDAVGGLANEVLITAVIDNERLVLAEKSCVPMDGIVEAIGNFHSPAYHLYNYQERKTFILTCPSGSKVRERMLYASNKQGFLNSLKSQGLEFTNVVEVGDASELETSEITGAPVEDANKPLGLRFAKPKGPRRR